MSRWRQEELEAIAKDENLYIAIPNPDGTMHKPTWIWIAQAGDDLYCRGYAGTNARWYQSAKREGKGHISVGGVEKEVHFEFPTDETTNEQVDEGYRQKYEGSPYLRPMVSHQARQATVWLVPAE
ncbi:DUF2255 family protein [Tetragenococcus solitarius]|uniref:DUF2255 family protein n=1 Tax=Tetragenococcus solitarius TaxID=71453 RepID=A0ABP6KNQ0_9ENTE|nr:DUF2255 family protein [Tetragenococcus solitarius]